MKSRNHLLHLIHQAKTGVPLELLEKERLVIRDVAENIAEGIYSVVSLSRKFQKLGAPTDESRRFAVSFIVREIAGGDLEKVPFFSLTEDERAELGEEFLETFFKAAEDTNVTNRQKQMLIENADALPAFDSNLKLWLAYLARNPETVWNLDIDDVSEFEAGEYLTRLLKQAETWKIRLRNGQIVIHGTERPGFDPDQRRLPSRNNLLGYLAESESHLQAVSLREGVVLRLKLNGDPIRKTADRFVAAEALRNGVPDPLRLRIDTPESLARARGLNYEGLLQSLRNYSRLAASA